MARGRPSLSPPAPFPLPGSPPRAAAPPWEGARVAPPRFLPPRAPCWPVWAGGGASARGASPSLRGGPLAAFSLAGAPLSWEGCLGLRAGVPPGGLLCSPWEGPASTPSSLGGYGRRGREPPSESQAGADFPHLVPKATVFRKPSFVHLLMRSDNYPGATVGAITQRHKSILRNNNCRGERESVFVTRGNDYYM